MATEPKTISRNDYLTGLALYTMGQKHSGKADEFNKALAEHLGLEEYSSVSDGVYSTDHEDFDTVLGYAGITVEPEAK